MDTETILRIVRSLKNQNSSGSNNISNTLLKEIAPYIIKPMYKLFNRSIRSGTVPKSFKQAKVIPVYKGKESGSPFEYNYRPISLLQSMSKVRTWNILHSGAILSKSIDLNGSECPTCFNMHLTSVSSTALYDTL